MGFHFGYQLCGKQKSPSHPPDVLDSARTLQQHIENLPKSVKAASKRLSLSLSVEFLSSQPFFVTKIMDAFEELSWPNGVNEVLPSSVPWSKGVNEVPSSSDPASEFLEREKAELGDVLGEPLAPTAEPVVDMLSADMLGLEVASPTTVFAPMSRIEPSSAPMEGLAASRSSSGKASPTNAFSSMPRIEQSSAPVAVEGLAASRSSSGKASPTTVFAPMSRIEPETIRAWRADNEKRLAEKDAKEEENLKQAREQAKKELADWYKKYNEQLAKTKSSNRSAEEEFVAEVNDIKPVAGAKPNWERINKMVDFNSKNSKSTQDTTRMKSILIQLKQNGKAVASNGKQQNIDSQQIVGEMMETSNVRE